MNINKQIAKLRLHIDRKIIHAGAYRSYEDAAKRCTKDLYKNSGIVHFVERGSSELREKLKMDETIKMNAGMLSILDAIQRIQSVSSHERKTIRVIDFGGGGGDYYLFIRKMLPAETALQWLVVETAPMIAAMKRHETGELCFCGSLEEALHKGEGRADLVFTSGAIQYTEDPYKTINDLLNLDASIMIFNRVSLSLEEYDIISIQTSLLSWHGLKIPIPKGFREKIIKYPHTNIQKKKFEELIFDKYKLLYTFEEASGIKKVKSFRIGGESYFCIKK